MCVRKYICHVNTAQRFLQRHNSEWDEKYLKMNRYDYITNIEFIRHHSTVFKKNRISWKTIDSDGFIFMNKSICTYVHRQLKKYHVFNRDYSFTITLKMYYRLESVHHHCQAIKKRERGKNNLQKKATSNHFIMETQKF